MYLWCHCRLGSTFFGETDSFTFLEKRQIKKMIYGDFLKISYDKSERWFSSNPKFVIPYRMASKTMAYLGKYLQPSFFDPRKSKTKHPLYPRTRTRRSTFWLFPADRHFDFLWKDKNYFKVRMADILFNNYTLSNSFLSNTLFDNLVK